MTYVNIEGTKELDNVRTVGSINVDLELTKQLPFILRIWCERNCLQHHDDMKIHSPTILDNSINRALNKTFGSGDTVSLQQMRSYLQLFSSSNLIDIKKCSYMDRLTESDSYAVLLKVFIALFYLSSCIVVLYFCTYLCSVSKLFVVCFLNVCLTSACLYFYSSYMRSV